MKIVSSPHIRIVVALGIAAIFVLQALWVSNMYMVYRKQYLDLINRSLVYATDKETGHRLDYAGKPFSVFFYPGKLSDTTRIITKTLVTEDTTIVIKYDRYDTRVDIKVRQFAFKKLYPLNPVVVDSIFRADMERNKYPVQHSFIEYIDIRADSLISCSSQVNTTRGFIRTEILPVDILDSIGVRANARLHRSDILNKMTVQLILSALLFIATIIALWILSKTIVKERNIAKLQRNFVDMMTHELRRPISGAVMMIGMIPALVRRNQIVKIGEYADKSLFELNKLSGYFKQVQAITKGRHEKMILNMTDVPLRSFIEDIKNRFSTAESKVINLVTHTDTCCDSIHVDLLHFSNVMDNLIENAIKYSGDPLELMITIREINDVINITVQDNGFGMSAIDKLYIFERFYRSPERNVQLKSGLGLGLTYVKFIVEAHGGKISVSSTLGQGSIFTITIPKAKNGNV